MKKSKFEGYSDKILFKFLKVILSTLDEEGINHINMKFNDEFTSSVDDALQFFGDTPLDYIDYDYLFELIKRNVVLLGGDTLTSNLNRPECSEFSFDVTVNAHIYQTEYYEHKISSYSENPYRIVQTKDFDGNFEYWEGVLKYTDTHDTEVNEINIEKNTFYKI